MEVGGNRDEKEKKTDTTPAAKTCSHEEDGIRHAEHLLHMLSVNMVDALGITQHTAPTGDALREYCSVWSENVMNASRALHDALASLPVYDQDIDGLRKEAQLARVRLLLSRRPFMLLFMPLVHVRTHHECSTRLSSFHSFIHWIIR